MSRNLYRSEVPPSFRSRNLVSFTFGGGAEGMALRDLILLCPLTLPDTAVFYRFDGGVDGMVLRGLVLLCPLSPS